jgi:hypothetical protein
MSDDDLAEGTDQFWKMIHTPPSSLDQEVAFSEQKRS